MDRLSSAIASINRCSKQHQASTRIPYNQFVLRILKLLIDLGYLRGFNLLDNYKAQVFIKYDEKGSSTFRTLTRISKPGSRLYISAKSLRKANKQMNSSNPLQTLIISTSYGLKVQSEAVLRSLGGEIILIVS